MTRHPQTVRIELLNANQFGISEVIRIGGIVDNAGTAATDFFLNNIRNHAALSVPKGQLGSRIQCASSIHDDTPCKSHLQVDSNTRVGQSGFADASEILSSNDCQISRKVISGSRSWET